MKEWINRNIFLIDGMGAFVTALMIGLILPLFDIGLSNRILYTLAGVALCYGVYSISCYLLKLDVMSNYLKTIIIANLTYCFFTLALVFYNFESMNLYGLLYFLGEVVVIVTLSWIEIEILNT